MRKPTNQTETDNYVSNKVFVEPVGYQEELKVLMDNIIRFPSFDPTTCIPTFPREIY